MTMARPASALNDAQLPLVGAVQAVHADAGKRIRALIRKAIADNGVSHSALAHELGMDESHLSRALADDKGAHPSPSVYAAVLALDAKRVLVGGLAAMCGGEWIEKRPDPEEENRKLRKQLRAAVVALSAALGEDA
jgi:AraC-like DNA-binding protein